MNVCRGCACSESSPCFIDEKGQSHTIEGLREITDRELEDMPLTLCHWVEFDLCSACVESPAPTPLLYGADGRPLRGAP